MPKIKVKTNSSLKKKFKITGTGKIMRHRSHVGHNTGSKSPTKMRRLKKETELNKSQNYQISRALGLK